MDDVHNTRDTRRVPIDLVGIRDLQYPIVVRDRRRMPQQTVARLSMAVNLQQERKGAHMSRLVEVVHAHRTELSLQTIPTILQILRTRLGADDASIEASFPFFISRAAPVSGIQALLAYECSLWGTATGHVLDCGVRVTVPITSVCPCSKSISDYGAHNQRGYVTIEARCAKSENGEPTAVEFEDLIDVVERSASAPVYTLLKREDERHVTMHAFDHPVFVEDILREVVVELRLDPRIGWFRVQVVNHESIHDHNVFATIEHTNAEAAAEVLV